MKRVLAAVIVVTTTHARAEEPVSLTVSGSSAPGFSASAKEGERPRDTPDAAALLEGLPGLRVRRLGGESGFATLSIRGAASNQVAISLFGVPLTGGADPSLDLSTLPLWPGATARVHRTFAPAFLAGGYLGGIVDLAPLDLTARRTETYNAYGSFGSYRMRVATAQKAGAWSVGAGVSFHRTQGDFTYYDPFLIDGMDVTRRNNETQQLGGIAHARHDGDRWTVLITTLLTNRRDGIAGPFDNPSLGTHMRRDRELVALEVRKRGEDGRFLARAWGRRDGFAFFDPLHEQGRLSETRYRTLATGLTFGRSLIVGKIVLDPRIDGSLESRSGDYLRARTGLSFDATYRVDATTLVLAARGDVRRDTDQRAELLPVAHVGLEHAFDDSLTFGAHLGTLARPPSFLELLGDGGVYSAAKGLRSERSYAADVGLRARGTRNKVRWEAELVGFAWEVRDLIAVLPVSALTLRAVNIGAARIAGGEVSLAATTGPVRAVASYTRLFTENRGDDVSERGAPLPGRPDHDLTLDVSVKVSALTLRYGFDLVSPTTLDRPGSRELPTRIFHGVGARLDIRSVSIVGEVHNLFDRRTVDVVYETGRPGFQYPVSDFLGYPLPGRRITVAARVTL